MAQLNTKIVLRNDSLENWESNNSVVLLKGEVGIAFDKDGKTLMKVGDGIKTWAELDWFQTSEDGVSQGALDALKVNLDALYAKVGNPSEGDIAATGIYGEIAALAESVGLLNKKVDEEVIGELDAKVDEKVDEKIDAFASRITDDGKINTVMELIKYVEAHGSETTEIVNNVESLKELVGDKPVSQQIQTAIQENGTLTSAALEALYTPVKYEISETPKGTQIKYDDNEIRIMCPADAKYEHQNVGNTGDVNNFYFAFKAYAPKNAVSFREDTAEIISDMTMYTFDENPFAGVDGYGRKYSILWLAAARYDAANDRWTYYGANSTKSKYVGWYYSVEWYDADGVMISSDCIRINLSNENCHNTAEPYYMGSIVKEISVNGVLCEVENNRVNIEMSAGNVVSGEEIAVNEDGTLSIQKVDASKIVTNEGIPLILNGGSASV